MRELVAIVASLSEAFEEIMKKKGPLKVTLFNDYLAAALKRLKANDFQWVHMSASLSQGMYDKVLVKLIADIEVMKDSIANHPDDVDRLFLILMLLKVSLDNPSFQNRIATDLA